MKCPACQTERIDDFICHHCSYVYDQEFFYKESEKEWEKYEEDRKELAEYNVKEIKKSGNLILLSIFLYFVLISFGMIIGFTMYFRDYPPVIGLFLGYFCSIVLLTFPLVEVTLKIQESLSKKFDRLEKEFFKEHPHHQQYRKGRTKPHTNCYLPKK